MKNDLDIMLQDCQEELSQYKNGYKGGCYACETVGETNVRLRNALEEIMNDTAIYQKGGGLSESLFNVAKKALEKADE